MQIRNATYRDAPAIKLLMEALGCKPTLSILINQLEMSFGQRDHQIFVYETKKEVVGFTVINFLPQLASEHQMVLITALSVDETAKDHGIDKILEEYVTVEARKRNCARVLALCSACREPASRFYLQQGYREYSEYFIKNLVYEK